MRKDAVLSADRHYRYSLTREWDREKPKVLFIGLNPSTADETEDDATIRRCIGFAKRWGYGAILVGNLFAIRSKSPATIYSAKDPVGPENDAFLLKMASEATLIVAAWGNDGGFRNRSAEVKKLFPNMMCLGINKTGEPKHPLYVRADQEPIALEGKPL